MSLERLRRPKRGWSVLSRMKVSCRHCGFPLENQSHCPKCQSSREQMGHNAVYEVDVAHSGESWEMAQSMIMDALDQAIYGHFRGLRVIHGYGSQTGQAVIAPRAISLMRHLAETHDGRFARDRKNQGVSLIWLNKSASKEREEKPYFSAESQSAGKQGNWFDAAVERGKRS
ncbi:hypothetical protein [Rubritalea tangerina]|uniref:Smr domain-containing protein n=1 Tax=Rubritalea tangerina TaxID=430798 RepID=A0ABW4Z6M7_9BACT